ncbi:AsnC family transcriptional regulator [Streptomyces sp. Go40/10]|uniref:Lrp/AsnC family transcriptional regulator n=1 Tax=Streptomyces sp. Go40/10 TaxID=2825844 RepID=UPI001E2EEC5C|nr:AsnC family transcriptional regulator [Streptomyces sp. Go40/10]UFR00396.1 AsnC family transcriptional regulator [Streptomyces sp. Go40/10]
MNDSDILDAVDHRIIAALQINPRAGVAEVGRILGEHERSVARRLQRLLNLEIVHFTAEYERLRSAPGHSAWLRLKARPGCLEAVGDTLARRVDALNVAAVSGAPGLLWCELAVPDRPLLHALAEGVPGLPDAEVLDMCLTLRPFKTAAEWHAPVLTDEEERLLRASLVQPLPVPADRYEPTPTDERVAGLLRHNARVSLTELARELGFSTATAGRRLASLLERRVLRLRTAVDPALLGRPARILLRLKVRPAGLEKVGTALAAHRDVHCCTAVTGPYALLAEVCLPHEKDVYGFLVDVLGPAGDVTDLDTAVITRAYSPGPGPDTPLRQAST